jgi:hypothetical protein
VNHLGEFFGGWFLTYIQAIGPIGGMLGALFNGILGNVIDPVKYLDTGINLKNQPLKQFLTSFNDLPRMLKAANDKRQFLTAVLGGQDPDLLNEIGINAGLYFNGFQLIAKSLNIIYKIIYRKN